MELLPDIVLPDFSAIELTRFKAEVASEAVDKALAQIAKYNRTLEPVSAADDGRSRLWRGQW